jgi:hypothetical protein
MAGVSWKAAPHDDLLARRGAYASLYELYDG